MATLADMGYLCMGWSEAGDEPGPIELSLATRQEGFPTRAALVAHCEKASGRTMGAADWYEALALFKTAVFMEGNYRRATEGSSDDAYNAAFGDSVVALARHARDVVRSARADAEAVAGALSADLLTGGRSRATVEPMNTPDVASQRPPCRLRFPYLA